MQEQALKTEFFAFMIRVRIAVSQVTRYSVPQMLRMYSNLVRTAGLWLALQQTEFTQCPRQAKSGLRVFSAAIDDDMALPVLAVLDIQGLINEAIAELPIANDQRQIVFFDLAIAKHLMQFAKCAAALCQHQATRGLTIQPVGERQVPDFRTGLTHQLDNAVADATAAVHRKSTGLIDHEESFVLEYDALLKACKSSGWRSGGIRTHARRWDTDFVTILQSIVSTNPTAIHPHLASSQNTVQAALWHTWQLAAQKVVDPLASELCVDSNLAHTGVPAFAAIASGGIHIMSYFINVNDL